MTEDSVGAIARDEKELVAVGTILIFPCSVLLLYDVYTMPAAGRLYEVLPVVPWQLASAMGVVFALGSSIAAVKLGVALRD